jgi:ABC-type transporter Mla maintaining outer membrane lipid asymmetry ATPase subunit MlaF
LLATTFQIAAEIIAQAHGHAVQNYALFDVLSQDNVGFTLTENSEMKPNEIQPLAHELIRILNLVGSEKLLPSELSGGMKKRVSLARSLISNPEVVLFDEPTTGLDPIMIAQVDEMIALAKDQYQITSAIISHDMASTKRLADTVAYLHGHDHLKGTYDEFREPAARDSRVRRRCGPSRLERRGCATRPSQVEVPVITDELSVGS